MHQALKQVVLIILLSPVMIYNLLWAQLSTGGNVNPGSLTLVTVSGYTMIDNSHMYPLYFLDEDQNGIADYFLNFGPHWYEPELGNATRPNEGDFITITGGLHDPINNTLGYPVIIAYEIDGEFWREPYGAFWLVGLESQHVTCPCGYCLHDSLQTVSVSGNAIVDTTFMFNKYYLDENQDDIPDYFLNFGPPWYEPPTGASRPENGDFIDIIGGLFEPDSLLPMIVVYEINGLTWRDSTFFGMYFSGCWIYRYMTQSQYAHSPWDTSCGIRIQAGWHSGGHPGMMMPDSIFCRVLQQFPQNMPQIQSQNSFAGFEIGLFGPNGSNLLMGGMMGGNQFTFNNQVQFKFHYNDIQLQGYNIDESTIQLKSWDTGSDGWIEVTDYQLNTADNTVSFSSEEIDRFYILTGQEKVVNVTDQERLLTDGFVLRQNYPNPFNPVTTIDFMLSKPSDVNLVLYNVLGQKLSLLLEGNMEAGFHQYNLDASTYSSGIYFYELKVGGKSQIRKMNLVR